MPCEDCGLCAGEGVGLRFGEFCTEKLGGSIEKLQVELAGSRERSDLSNWRL
jgi:hypothetical protein